MSTILSKVIDIQRLYILTVGVAAASLLIPKDLACQNISFHLCGDLTKLIFNNLVFVQSAINHDVISLSNDAILAESRAGLLDPLDAEWQEIAISSSVNKVSIRWRVGFLPKCFPKCVQYEVISCTLKHYYISSSSSLLTFLLLFLLYIQCVHINLLSTSCTQTITEVLRCSNWSIFFVIACIHNNVI